jgi:hypothetical protein
MSRADITLSERVSPNTHVDRARDRVYVDRRMSGMRDGDVSCRTEQ